MNDPRLPPFPSYILERVPRAPYLSTTVCKLPQTPCHANVVGYLVVRSGAGRRVVYRSLQ